MNKDLGSWSDDHLEPLEEPIVGYDFLGNELYGHEYGVVIDGEFIQEEDIMTYIENMYGMVISGEVLNNPY